MTCFTHTWTIRVYYEDTDHGGVVYYANYLKFMERARTEFLRSEGIELDKLELHDGVLFSVTEASIRYHSPACFNQMLEVKSRLLEVRGARLAFDQRIVYMDNILVSAGIKLACVDRTGRPRRIPVAVLRAIRSRISGEINNDS